MWSTIMTSHISSIIMFARPPTAFSSIISSFTIGSSPDKLDMLFPSDDDLAKRQLANSRFPSFVLQLDCIAGVMMNRSYELIVRKIPRESMCKT